MLNKEIPSQTWRASLMSLYHASQVDYDRDNSDANESGFFSLKNELCIN